MYYINNQVNISLNKPEITLYESLKTYHKLYETKEEKIKNKLIEREKYIYIGVIISLFIISITLYKKK